MSRSRRSSLAALGLLAAAVLAAPPSRAADLRLRLLQTSDVHMNLLDYDYYQDRAVQEFGLALSISLIHRARAEAPNSLLFDNGDLLQGSPLGDVVARVRPLKAGDTHPAYKVLNLLGVDAANLGNHEFNYGLPFLRQVLAGANFPYLNANVMAADGRRHAFTPSVMLTREFKDEQGRPHRLKIGVLGITSFRPFPLAAVRAALAQARPDIIIHSAWEGVGGVLDLHAQVLDRLVQAAQQRANGRYEVDPAKFSQLAWAEVKPRYRRLIDRIVRAKTNIIICTRAKPVMQQGFGEKQKNARKTKTRRDDVPWDPASDGDLMEGISHEAASLAGHLQLKNLIVLYDDNGISIDGSTALSFTDDTTKRFDAYNWATKTVDGHNHDEIDQAIVWAKTQDKPVLISCKTTIGFGSPNKKGTHGVHGSPLGAEEIKASRTEGSLHRRVHRPWGWYDSIDMGPRFQVKRIMVKPKASLSLQMHHHRAEHWIVVSGTAEVTVGEQVLLLSENQSTYIPLGTVHRLVNPGAIPLEIIEVQSGSYLGEDDIVRFQDNYGRSA